jgi:hypothetical protein
LRRSKSNILRYFRYPRGTKGHERGTQRGTQRYSGYSGVLSGLRRLRGTLGYSVAQLSKCNHARSRSLSRKNGTYVSAHARSSRTLTHAPHARISDLDLVAVSLSLRRRICVCFWPCEFTDTCVLHFSRQEFVRGCVHASLRVCACVYVVCVCASACAWACVHLRECACAWVCEWVSFCAHVRFSFAFLSESISARVLCPTCVCVCVCVERLWVCASRLCGPSSGTAATCGVNGSAGGARRPRVRLAFASSVGGARWPQA